MGIQLRLPTKPREGEERAVIEGRARVDRRTKNLVPRLRRGEIAVIHHKDIDTLAALALLERNVRAVINAERSISGRYPCYGALILIEAGVPLIDWVGEEFFAQVREGSRVRIKGAHVQIEGGAEANGFRLDRETVLQQIEEAKHHLGTELEAFAQNTLEYLHREWHLFFQPLLLPTLRTPLKDRHVVVVTRAPDYERDLQTLRPYLKEMRPVFVAVDGAADALLDHGYRPHLILGDMDSISERALRCGAELVVHGYLDETRPSPGLERCQQLGLETHLLRAPGTSEDVAMLLAYEMGAQLIVAVGSHFGLEEFLDKGRAGMSSTFLVRLKVGTRLVDAKGVSRLYASHRPPRELLWLFLAALAPIAVVFAFSQTGQFLLRLLRSWWRVWFG